MNECSHCGRRLLSKASASCNWCGKEIEDPAYQAQAQTERDAFFARQAEHDAQSLAALRAAGTNAHDPLALRDPLDGPLLGFDPRPTAARRGSADPRQRARQDTEDRTVRRAVEQALAEQQKEDAARRTAPPPRTVTGFPQRPGAATVPPPAPPAVAESPEETPEPKGARFSHLEL